MRLPVPDPIPRLEDLGTVHFVGIGGAGLSAIARVMAQRGLTVTGSDNADTPFLRGLHDLGVEVSLGYAADHVEHLGADDTVVVTTAATEDNPEVVAAHGRGCRLLPRSAGLAAAMEDRRVVAVTGTHGKTTTTSLLASALIAAGDDPGYAIGGVLSASGLNAEAGTGAFVAEADESDGAFLVYRPAIGLITGIDADHLDQWGTPEAYAAAFDDFLGTVSEFCVINVDDDGARRLTSSVEPVETPATVVTVGTDPLHDPDYLAANIRLAGSTSTFQVLQRGVADPLGTLTLQIPGRHYVVDALAALAVGLRLGHPFGDLAKGIEDFTGTQRRMETKGVAAGVRVVDTYAHHPTEIVADLEAARALADGGRVVVVFQPHLPSRTAVFGVEMGAALTSADEIVVAEVYLAREPADAGPDAGVVSDAAAVGGARVHRPGVPIGPDLAELVAGLVQPGDLLLTAGAGDVTELGPLVLSALEASS